VTATTDRPPTTLRAPSNDRPSAGPDLTSDQGGGVIHPPPVAGEQTLAPTTVLAVPIRGSSGRGTDTAATKLVATSTAAPSLPPDPDGQAARDNHRAGAVGNGTGPAERDHTAPDNHPGLVTLADPVLRVLAEVVDDLETSRIANAHRLYQLTSDRVDKDGTRRGWGVPAEHPAAQRLAAVVEGIQDLEKQATRNLERAMRAHPLGLWITGQLGGGHKQGARLLAAVGDPYWHDLEQRPRTVQELRAYCGLHPVPADQERSGIQSRGVSGGMDGGGLDQSADDGHYAVVRVAARRRRGEKANWSTEAKTRALNIARKCVISDGQPDKNGRPRGRSPYRDVYDKRKANTAGRVHAVPCPPCGPEGKPAAVGSPWSDAHRNADAVRITAQRFLRDLWREARRLHAENVPADHASRDDQTPSVGGEQL
jgi:hypothetical protein